AGIKPLFACDQPGICATRQACGDVDYLLAVNATHDPQGSPQLGMKATAATIALAGDQRPIYDAVLGGPAAGFVRQDGKLAARLRFGPGQMRVFARTARSIAAVRVATPMLRRDYTVQPEPIAVDVTATVVDVE